MPLASTSRVTDWTTFVPADNAATACDTSKFQLLPSEYERFTGNSAIPPSMDDWKVKSVDYKGDIASITSGRVEDANRKLVPGNMQWHFKRSTAEAPSNNNENAEPAT